jgi:hypothetical protein
MAVGEPLTPVTLIVGFAGAYRVHYSLRGSGRDITVQAESSAEARAALSCRSSPAYKVDFSFTFSLHSFYDTED